MANTASHHSGHSGGGRRWRWPGRALTLTRRDLLAFLIATMLCSASYCLGIWHNSRGAADSRILWPAAVGATSSCGGSNADEPLDFEAHHTAEAAGLSVSASAARTTSTRRALRATETAPAAASWGAAWMGNSIAGKR